MPKVEFSSTSFSQPDWAAQPLDSTALVPGGAFLVVSEFPAAPLYEINVSSAGAALGATTLPVEALPVALQAGTTLDFGALAAEVVTVASTPADDATTLAVNALTRAIPANTFLSFPGGKFAIVTTAAAIGATSLTTLAMPAGTKPVATNAATLPAGRKTATLTASAAVGATSLTVAALGFQAVDADKANYGVSSIINVPSGTLVGRTYAERDAGIGYGQPDVVTPDDQLYLTAFEVIDLRNNNEVALVRHQTLIYEDRLPGWSSLSTGVKTAIRQRYQCIKSAN